MLGACDLAMVIDEDCMELALECVFQLVWHHGTAIGDFLCTGFAWLGSDAVSYTLLTLPEILRGVDLGALVRGVESMVWEWWES